ncbi:MAG: DUF4340 domain-containing protein [Myxococcales bacterium]|nr:DUF4340 domain-containing protein [Myxococcales bacterium]
MNRTTILSVVIALASLGGALAMRPVAVEPQPYEDTGDLLFPTFTDPSQATSLEVTTWDETEARLTSFQVEQKDGRWVIPSHNDYPADGTERMGKAAASFIDARRDIVRSDRSEDHAAFGVEDPDKADGTGRGQRITIKDSAGAILVDVIVGKQVEDKPGYRYVRFPDQKRVYASKLTLDVSTEFTDWIEKDLLKLDADSVVQVISDAYKVDEKEGKVTGRDPLAVALEAPADNPAGLKVWRPLEGVTIPAGKEVDSAKVRQMVSAMDRLNIVGVRPRPAQLTLGALQAKGFFVTPDGSRLFGNEGELRAICDDGVVYTLYFGEITFDSGLALTAGAGDQVGAGDSAEGEGEKKANRFMFVDVNYDPEVDQKKGEDETAGLARAKALQGRFDRWFYVISDDSFQQMHKAKEELLKDEGAAAAPAGPPGMPPGMPPMGMPMMPGM